MSLSWFIKWFFSLNLICGHSSEHSRQMLALTPLENHEIMYHFFLLPITLFHTRYNYCNFSLSLSIYLAASNFYLLFVSTKITFHKTIFFFLFGSLNYTYRNETWWDEWVRLSIEGERRSFVALLAEIFCFFFSKRWSGEWNVRNRNHHQSNDYRPNKEWVRAPMCVRWRANRFHPSIGAMEMFL